ncbi:hypothetical protein NKR23_g914 [Pleurostoma richardsiae]|uniref:Uncharacterized protein n=1 Tax=Pleurostoma richardsiae TaxID=41990 RepID=A0AA38VZV4_9PEZI|nr:hypothetical protein NKR23_g914 [Pleurostoma richardsiae]
MVTPPSSALALYSAVTPCPLRLSHSDVAAITSSVNRDLLRCHAALFGTIKPTASRRRCETALVDANSALETATVFRRHDLAAKAQLHRGHCFAALGMWRLAHGCYVRGASALALKGGGGGLEDLTGRCLREMERERREDEEERQEELRRESVRVHCGLPAVEEEELVREEALDWHLLRDGTGRIVDIVDGRPALRSVRGRSWDSKESNE